MWIVVESPLGGAVQISAGASQAGWSTFNALLPQLAPAPVIGCYF